MNELNELTRTEYLEISGGRVPDADSSIFYDVGWWLGTGYRRVESWFR